MAQVKLEKVSKVYPGNVRAVAPMDLDIAHGEFTVLVGPSGCGKSTTLRMIAGLEEITEGEISIGDRVVNDIEPRDRDIAMVFQSYALYPHMTVEANMAFGLRMRKIPKEEITERVGEAARVLGIEDLLARKPRALSGGQRQRVALGRAIVRNPEVFLFDEPLSNLDAKMRVQMRTEIARLHHSLGATMVYVTHDQTEAMTLGQRIVVMKDGFVQQVAPPLELYERPANRFVGGFIGSPAMNFLPGKLIRQDGLALVARDGTVWPLPAGFTPPAELLDKSLVLGIRPEHLIVGGDQPGLVADLQVLESLGNETLAYFQVAGEPFTARYSGQLAAAIDEELNLSFTAEHIHLFGSGEQGLNLLNKG
ncbi:MAG: sn-glycerol-3-phosphate ABC transporter ATP-binding protein UgpC [Candidatus Krumholzibacteria bacterium]|nr:sn-glycerol-3-phosphate ABC transporter ATP-binding protein UgpC [Candidatus Krumholzibacteria bacterium]